MVAAVVAIRLLELFSPHVAERGMVRAIVTADAFRQRELRRAPQRAAAPLDAFARELSLRTCARGRERARPRSLTPGRAPASASRAKEKSGSSLAARRLRRRRVDREPRGPRLRALGGQVDEPRLSPPPARIGKLRCPSGGSVCGDAPCCRTRMRSSRSSVENRRWPPGVRDTWTSPRSDHLRMEWGCAPM